MTRHWWCVLFASLLVTAEACRGPTARERRIVENWLLCEECGAGESDSLVALGDRAVSPLSKALEGPSARYRRNVRRQAEASYARISANGSPSVDRAAFIEHYVGNFVAVYQSRSATALGLIGTPRALAALRVALGRPPSYYRSDVRRAIATALDVSISIAAGNSQTAPLSTAVAIDPSVVARDRSGHVVRGVPVRFRPASGGGGVMDSLQFTDDSGRASVGSWTLGATPGLDTLRAVIPGDTALFFATATSSASFISIAAGDSQRIAAATPVPVRPAVLATDTAGTTRPGIVVTFSIDAGGGSVAGATPTTDTNGIATVGSWTLGSVPGINRLRASSPGLAPVTFTATGTVSMRMVSTGGSHSCAVTTSGVAYCWGGNANGELGDGSTTMRTRPVVVAGGLNVESISAGGAHTCGRTANGEVYCWGLNLAGALGDSTTTTRLTPVLVKGGIRFEKISSGGGWTCGITNAGAAYCWGSNGNGQLGDSSTTNRLTPVAVRGGLTFSQISAGGGHTCGLNAAGKAYCWGRNHGGQLGDSTTTNRSTPVAVHTTHTFLAISAGGSHTCGVTTTEIFCWGKNTGGQIGDGSMMDRLQLREPGLPPPVDFVTVSAATSQLTPFDDSWSCGITATAATYCWGRNDVGQLGDGTHVRRLAPVTVAGVQVFASISAGRTHTCGLTSGREVYCWGDNSRGQLGDGTVAPRAVPSRVREP